MFWLVQQQLSSYMKISLIFCRSLVAFIPRIRMNKPNVYIQLVFSNLLLLPYFFYVHKIPLWFYAHKILIAIWNYYTFSNSRKPFNINQFELTHVCFCVYICVHAHVCDGMCARMCTCVYGGQRQLFFRLCLPWFWGYSLSVACKYVSLTGNQAPTSAALPLGSPCDALHQAFPCDHVG